MCVCVGNEFALDMVTGYRIAYETVVVWEVNDEREAPKLGEVKCRSVDRREGLLVIM